MKRIHRSLLAILTCLLSVDCSSRPELPSAKTYVTICYVRYYPEALCGCGPQEAKMYQCTPMLSASLGPDLNTAEELARTDFNKSYFGLNNTQSADITCYPATSFGGSVYIPCTDSNLPPPGMPPIQALPVLPHHESPIFVALAADAGAIDLDAGPIVETPDGGVVLDPLPKDPYGVASGTTCSQSCEKSHPLCDPTLAVNLVGSFLCAVGQSCSCFRCVQENCCTSLERAAQAGTSTTQSSNDLLCRLNNNCTDATAYGPPFDLQTQGILSCMNADCLGSCPLPQFGDVTSGTGP